jgi:acetate---CoA ligase (ADP-forming)
LVDHSPPEGLPERESVRKNASNVASLGAFFRARSIALVGATERSIWSNATFNNFGELGFNGAVHPVSPKGGLVHGLPATASCRAIGEPVDAALLMVRMDAIGDAFDDLRGCLKSPGSYQASA